MVSDVGMGPVVAEIYDALGEPERAALLRHWEGDQRVRAEGLAVNLEAAYEEITKLEIDLADTRDALQSDLDDERARVAAIAKILKPIPTLVDEVGYRLDALTAACDEALAAVKAARS